MHLTWGQETEKARKGEKDEEISKHQHENLFKRDLLCNNILTFSKKMCVQGGKNIYRQPFNRILKLTHTQTTNTVMLGTWFIFVCVLCIFIAPGIRMVRTIYTLSTLCFEKESAFC